MPVCRPWRPPRTVGSLCRVQPAGADDDEEALLARLIDLEQWLADDMARKPKHQKPSLQAQWQEEIARLLNQLT